MNENSSFEDDIQAIWVVVSANSHQLFLITRSLERIEKTLLRVESELIKQRPDCLKNDELNK